MTKPTFSTIHVLFAAIVAMLLAGCGTDAPQDGRAGHGKKNRLAEWFPESEAEAESSGVGEIHREGTDIIDFQTASVFAIEQDGELVLYASNHPYAYNAAGNCVGSNGLALTSGQYPAQESWLEIGVTSFEWSDAAVVTESSEPEEASVREEKEEPSDWIFSYKTKAEQEDKEFFSEGETDVRFVFPEGENQAIGTVRFYQGIPEQKTDGPIPFSAHVDIQDPDGEMFYEVIFESEIYQGFCE